MGYLAGSSRYVDYGRVADRYRRGRELSPVALDRWRAAVAPHLPSGPLRVIDIGAGTGMFAAAWPQWAPATVVAIEPNPGMIAAGHPGVRFVRGVAEALPVADACMDVAWVSTAVHHFTELDRAIAECARVLSDRGRVLVRTFLPGQTEITWLASFPGQAKALTRFPDLAQLAARFAAHGLRVSHTCDVTEYTFTFAAGADWVEQMREADSMLTALTDDEVAEGVRRLRAQPSHVARSTLSLVVFSRD